MIMVLVMWTLLHVSSVMKMLSVKHVNPLTPQATLQAPVFAGVLRTWAAQLYTTLAPQASGPIEHGYVFLLI